MTIFDNNFTEEFDYKAENIYLKAQLKEMQSEHIKEMRWLVGRIQFIRENEKYMMDRIKHPEKKLTYDPDTYKRSYKHDLISLMDGLNAIARQIRYDLDNHEENEIFTKRY